MSNPYKEIVEKLANSYPALEEIWWGVKIYDVCGFCGRLTDGKHQENCLVVEAKTLLTQNPDSEEDNPWIPCSERLPEEDGDYVVTTKNGNLFYDEPFNGDWWQRDPGGVIAWMPKPKPYQPPVQKIERSITDGRIAGLTTNEIIAKIGNHIGEAAFKPIDGIRKPEPTPDPLMGWKPLWRDGLPDTSREVRVLLQKGGLKTLRESVGYCDRSKEWFIHWKNGRTVVAWKEIDSLLDAKLFEKPTPPPPKHLPLLLNLIPFEERLPVKIGGYLLHNIETGTWDPWHIDKPWTDSMIKHYSNYTHWAQVR